MDIVTSGKSILLRPMTQKEHRALWRKYTPDPASGEKFVYDEQKADELFAALEEKSDWCPAAGIFTKTDEIIGMVRLVNVVYSENRADVFFLIASESLRGKGIGTEALRLLIKYARSEYRINRFYASAPLSNKRAAKALEKCGFINSRVAKAACENGDDRLDYVLRF